VIQVEIPGWKNLRIENIVLDLNGTISQGGKVSRGTKTRIAHLASNASLFVLTADTRGNVRRLLDGFQVEIKILTSKSEKQEKGDFVRSLGNEKVAYIGNGANDELAMKKPGLSICVMGKEGCYTPTALNSHIIVPTINDALDLLLFPERIVATLRR